MKSCLLVLFWMAFGYLVDISQGLVLKDVSHTDKNVIFLYHVSLESFRLTGFPGLTLMRKKKERSVRNMV